LANKPICINPKVAKPIKTVNNPIIRARASLGEHNMTRVLCMAEKQPAPIPLKNKKMTAIRN
jgi:hypothetical protein